MKNLNVLKYERTLENYGFLFRLGLNKNKIILVLEFFFY